MEAYRALLQEDAADLAAKVSWAPCLDTMHWQPPFHCSQKCHGSRHSQIQGFAILVGDWCPAWLLLHVTQLPTAQRSQNCAAAVCATPSNL